MTLLDWAVFLNEMANEFDEKAAKNKRLGVPQWPMISNAVKCRVIAKHLRTQAERTPDEEG